VDRFVSHCINRFDAKGRISLPAAFRAVLAKEGSDALHVCPSLDAQALDCGGERMARQIDALLATAPLYSPQRDALATALFGACEIVRADSEGRIMLSEAMRGFAGLTDAAAFVGQGDKFQIWAPAAFVAHLDAARARLRLLRRETGAEAAASLGKAAE
jgi:MraZ protein